MNRHIIYAFLWLALAIYSYHTNIGQIWVPLMAVAVFQGYMAFRRKPQAVSVPFEHSKKEPAGQLGRFLVENTDSFGLYIDMAKGRVFVDIREDKQTESRKARALELFKHVTTLDASLAAFCTRHPEFATRQVTYIGLHSPDVQEAEVFWEPEGHTLLRGFEFVK